MPDVVVLREAERIAQRIADVVEAMVDSGETWELKLLLRDRLADGFYVALAEIPEGYGRRIADAVEEYLH